MNNQNVYCCPIAVEQQHRQQQHRRQWQTIAASSGCAAAIAFTGIADWLCERILMSTFDWWLPDHGNETVHLSTIHHLSGHWCQSHSARSCYENSEWASPTIRQDELGWTLSSLPPRIVQHHLRTACHLWFQLIIFGYVSTRSLSQSRSFYHIPIRYCCMFRSVPPLCMLCFPNVSTRPRSVSRSKPISILFFLHFFSLFLLLIKKK